MYKALLACASCHVNSTKNLSHDNSTLLLVQREDKYARRGLIPRPHPAFQCCMKSCATCIQEFNLLHPHDTVLCTRPSLFSVCNIEKLGVGSCLPFQTLTRVYYYKKLQELLHQPDFMRTTWMFLFILFASHTRFAVLLWMTNDSFLVKDVRVALILTLPSTSSPKVYLASTVTSKWLSSLSSCLGPVKVTSNLGRTAI